MNIPERIIRTVAYFDLFDYPLTETEVWRWLFGADVACLPDRQVSFGEAEKAIADLVACGKLKREGGFICAADRDGLPFIREERFRHAARKWKRARRWAAAFAAVPGVELVGIGNTLAYNNAKDSSDIDFFIVTAPGTIWRNRIFCAGLAALFNLRPRLGDSRDKLCLSFFVTSDNLAIAPAFPDIYLSYWLRQMAPVAGRAETASAFRAANGGLTERGLTGKAVIWAWLFKPIGWLPGDFLKNMQNRRFPEVLRASEARRDGSVVISDRMLKFHVNDRRAEVSEKWEKRSEELLKAIK
jgi:hypothetical protein